MSSPSPSVFTATSAYSLAAIAGIAVIATAAARTLLPKHAPWQDRVAFIWLVRTPSFPLPKSFFWASLMIPIRFHYYYDDTPKNPYGHNATASHI